MKLLLYSHFFAPSIGGVETIVLSLAQGLAELRDSSGAPEFEITLVTQTPTGNFDDSALPFRVFRQPGLRTLWQLIRSADVVHLAGPALAPLLLTRLARKPLAIEHHGYQATCPNGLLFHHPTQSVCRGHFEAGNYLECWNCNSRIDGSAGSLRLLASTSLRRAGSRSAAKNVAPSSHVASRQGLPHTVVIPHGVEDPLNASNTAASSLTNDTNRFAYVGRLVVEKGVSVLLQATRMLRDKGRDIQVLLIGDGPERARLQSQIASARLESCVRITGFLTGSRLAEVLRGVRVLVMPSAWEETAGLAAIDHMMRGRLVIAARIGGLAEMVNDAGLTFTPGNAEALASAMETVLKDRSIIPLLGLKARDRALRFFLRERMIKDHAHLYQGLFASRGK